MKVVLEVGKFYRRENGVLVRYQPGDVFKASPDELRRLEAKEQVFVRKSNKPAPDPTPDVPDTPDISDVIPAEAYEVEALSDDDLLDRYTTRSGSWYLFGEGRKVQGRTKALEIARELHGKD